MEQRNFDAEIERLKKELAAVETEKANKELEEKKIAAEARKADAGKVEEAFKNLNATTKENNMIVAEARQTYLNIVRQAEEDYKKVIDSRNTILKSAQDKYDAALNEFIKNHPEGYHLTLKDGDTTQTISSQVVNQDIFGYDDFVNDIFEFMYNKNKKIIDNFNKIF